MFICEKCHGVGCHELGCPDYVASRSDLSPAPTPTNEQQDAREMTRVVMDDAWGASPQRNGTMPAVRRTGFDAGFRAGYEQALRDLEDVEQGEMSRSALLSFGEEASR